MSSNLGNLGDLFPETEVKCRIRGCPNLIHISGAQAMRNVATGQGRERMCDSCFELFNRLADREVPCSTPGCTGRWIWNRFQQVEAHVQGLGDEPPAHGLCSRCLERSRRIEEVQVPCRIRGCRNTWTWSGRSQMAAVDGKPPRRLCDSCFRTLKTLKDIELPCRVKGCGNTYLWTTYQQLEHLAAGRRIEEPPRRMCRECAEKFRTLQDIERKCKINGCPNTWRFSVFEQLEQWVADKTRETPEIPSRMCKSCFDFYNSARDIQVPCRIRGCEHTWTWTRSMQLWGRVHGRDKPPARLCEACQARLKELQDLEQPCLEPGCPGTWTYKAEDRLRDELQGRAAPRRRCSACTEFLAGHESQELVCRECGGRIVWSPEEQLLFSLGSSVRPELCSGCVGRQLQEIRPAEAAPVRPGFRVVVPSSGPWSRDHRIQSWPVRIDGEVVKACGQASVRVVCIGDEMTLSAESPEESWPVLLAGMLEERMGYGPGELQVVNAGMAGSTTRLGIDRFRRDVAPFEPALVIFSFAFQDARSDLRGLDGEGVARRLQELAGDFEEFVGLLRGLRPGQRMLCWLPNPVGAGDREIPDLGPEERQLFLRLYEGGIRQLGALCRDGRIPLMDGNALFKAVGARGAAKWMRDWCMPNAIGARNIASWILEAIRTNGLL